jgi:hypothetical protein
MPPVGWIDGTTEDHSPILEVELPLEGVVDRVLEHDPHLFQRVDRLGEDVIRVPRDFLDPRKVPGLDGPDRRPPSDPGGRREYWRIMEANNIFCPQRRDGYDEYQPWVKADNWGGEDGENPPPPSPRDHTRNGVIDYRCREDDGTWGDGTPGGSGKKTGGNNGGSGTGTCTDGTQEPEQMDNQNVTEADNENNPEPEGGGDPDEFFFDPSVAAFSRGGGGSGRGGSDEPGQSTGGSSGIGLWSHPEDWGSDPEDGGPAEFGSPVQANALNGAWAAGYASKPPPGEPGPGRPPRPNASLGMVRTPAHYNYQPTEPGGEDPDDPRASDGMVTAATSGHAESLPIDALETSQSGALGPES